MKVYIAGKITGDPDYREKFNAVEKLLASQGYSVMNPARLGNYPGFSWEEYMSVSASMQRVCDAVVFLPDWEDSKGARLEQKTAESLGQKIFLLRVVPQRSLLVAGVSEESPFGRCEYCNAAFPGELTDEFLETIDAHGVPFHVLNVCPRCSGKKRSGKCV